MVEMTRRTVLEGAAATALMAFAPLTPCAALPSPPLDIEAWIGEPYMTRARELCALELIHVPDKRIGRPPLMTEDGRFNMSPSVRYAVAKVIDEGPDVLCPAEPGLEEHYKDVFYGINAQAGIKLYGIAGELADPPHQHVWLITRDFWTLSRARGGRPIPPLGAYQWFGHLKHRGLAAPDRPAVERPADMPQPCGRAPNFDEQFGGEWDRRRIGLA